MNLQNELSMIIDAMMDKSCDDAGVISLGELSRMLNFWGSLNVYFSDGTTPGRLHSYRGVYSYIAIETGEEPVMACDLGARCLDAIGQSFEGYKGGDFVMKRRTPVFVAEWGSTGEGIVGLDHSDGKVIIKTKEVDF